MAHFNQEQLAYSSIVKLINRREDSSFQDLGLKVLELSELDNLEITLVLLTICLHLLSVSSNRVLQEFQCLELIFVDTLEMSLMIFVLIGTQLEHFTHSQGITTILKIRSKNHGISKTTI